MALFKIESLSFKYPERKELILDKIDIEIKEGSFITICGKSGCGKTTLLKHLKPMLMPYGHRKGRIYFKNKLIKELDERTQTMKIGYVLQNPEQQIVTDKVWHELAFGLESLGYDTQNIRLRVAEMASFFGIQNWFHKSTYELSGGQKQILNLAAIMVMQPEVLILDEPTAQLDPIATRNFIEILRRINVELGTTIILSEHHLEEVLPISDEVIVIEQGKKLVQGTVMEVGHFLWETKHELFKAMPAAMQIALEIAPTVKKNAITVRDGRNFLGYLMTEKCKRSVLRPYDKVIENRRDANEVILQLKEIYFKYDKHAEDILNGVTWNIKQGALYAIVGGNGTGKTTTLSIIAGIYKPYRGKIKWQNKEIKPVMLPQNPQEIFSCNTVYEELEEMVQGIPTSLKIEKLSRIVKLFELENLLEVHPYDLSGGQMQCVALAKVLLLEPKFILLDEPTKGIDIAFKEKLGKIFNTLKDSGITLVMVSHDLDFCARYSDECALFFDGQIISNEETKAFFCDNNFYTTTANRISRGLVEGCITSEEVVNVCQTHLQEANINA